MPSASWLSSRSDQLGSVLKNTGTRSRRNHTQRHPGRRSQNRLIFDWEDGGIRRGSRSGAESQIVCRPNAVHSVRLSRERLATPLAVPGKQWLTSYLLTWKNIRWP